MAKSKEELLFEARKLVYGNASELHRYFLSWRHQLFAGYLAVLAALAIAFNWAYNLQHHPRAWIGIVSIMAIALSVLFWLLEFRNRQLYRSSQNIARNLEQQMGVAQEELQIKNGGVYDELIRTTDRFLNHSSIMNMFFMCTIIFLILLTLATLFILK